MKSGIKINRVMLVCDKTRHDIRHALFLYPAILFMNHSHAQLFVNKPCRGKEKRYVYNKVKYSAYKKI